MGFFSCCGGGRGAPGVDEPLHPRPAYRRGGPRGFRRRRKGPRSVNSERDGSVISGTCHAVPADCSRPQYTVQPGNNHPYTSALAESEWHDARDAFSFTDEGGGIPPLTQAAWRSPHRSHHACPAAVLSAEDLELSGHGEPEDPVRCSSRVSMGSRAAWMRSSTTHSATPSIHAVHTLGSTTNSSHSRQQTHSILAVLPTGC